MDWETRVGTIIREALSEIHATDDRAQWVIGLLKTRLSPEDFSAIRKSWHLRPRRPSPPAEEPSDDFPF
jgi:hypothetical protein